MKYSGRIIIIFIVAGIALEWYSGELVASGNANPSDIKSVNRTILNVFRGQAHAIIRPFEDHGEIVVSVKADGLRTATLRIQLIS
jgi:hypothetical protein